MIVFTAGVCYQYRDIWNTPVDIRAPPRRQWTPTNDHQRRLHVTSLNYIVPTLTKCIFTTFTLDNHHRVCQFQIMSPRTAILVSKCTDQFLGQVFFFFLFSYLWCVALPMNVLVSNFIYIDKTIQLYSGTVIHVLHVWQLHVLLLCSLRKKERNN